jgi:transcriptional regulator with XRE-family HTH domain
MTALEPDAVAETVRHNVRELRQSRQLTLEALASRAGISKGMVVQIEQGRTNPSLTTLARLALALGVSLPRLVQNRQQETLRVVAADQSMLLWSGDNGGEGYLLASADDPTSLQLWSFRLLPGDSHRAAPQAPGTVEIVHVLRGRLRLRLGSAECAAEAGESVVFRPVLEHEYLNAGTRPLELTIASTEPSIHDGPSSDVAAEDTSPEGL